ncbi:hypothetical protein T01_3918 [Trichinella spiralis]|uniref:Uncharacterized protein n=1 Tax=Trichinella spiralis TaxID=6334 RepID=A0A0V1B4N1_TRISP|nr:hypothetical protein T01_3918 [Trichinella spiralis]
MAASIYRLKNQQQLSINILQSIKNGRVFAHRLLVWRWDSFGFQPFDKIFTLINRDYLFRMEINRRKILKGED